MGDHKVPTNTIDLPNALVFNNAYKQKNLDYLESCWIEFTTTENINLIKLHMQDEYSYDIKPCSATPVNSKHTFQAELQFADVPYY